MDQNFTNQLMTTLVSSLQAVTPEGDIDHKTRLAALKEARNLIATLLPKMSTQAREEFSKSITDQFAQKMAAAQGQELLLNKLIPEEDKKTTVMKVNTSFMYEPEA